MKASPKELTALYALLLANKPSVIYYPTEKEAKKGFQRIESALQALIKSERQERHL